MPIPRPRLARLGDVEFSVVSEERPEFSSEISDRPVERGANIVDHVRPLPVTLTLTGVVTGDDAAQRLERLRRYREEAELLIYIGRNVLRDVVIQSLNTGHTAAVRDGFEFTLTLRQVRIVRPETASLVLPAIRPVEEAGQQQPGTESVDPERRTSWLYGILRGVNAFLEKVSP